MQLVNCIVLAQCLLFTPSKGGEYTCSCQQFTEKLNAMEGRLLDAMKNQTDAVDGNHCPDTWVSFNKGCYLFSNKAATFFGASALCELHGSRLAYVESEPENAFIKTHIMGLKGEGSFWIGLTDLYVEGVFTWYGSSVSVSYADWLPQQPDNHRQDEHCVHYYTINNKFGWNDAPCSWISRFVCEK